MVPVRCNNCKKPLPARMEMPGDDRFCWGKGYCAAVLMRQIPTIVEGMASLEAVFREAYAEAMLAAGSTCHEANNMLDMARENITAAMAGQPMPNVRAARKR